MAQAAASTSNMPNESKCMTFRGEFDEKGVYVYQAFNDNIADWALEHQAFGGPDFNPHRMTWFKPSFAWVLYRSGYGRKVNQTRVLKMKISHKALGLLLSSCSCKEGGGGSWGRVQWDPARDLMSSEGKQPRRMLIERAIQVGVKGKLSQQYVQSVLSIEDVTPLAHQVGAAHSHRTASSVHQAMLELSPILPNEREYVPKCTIATLVELGMLPGETAAACKQLGRGKVGKV